MVPKVTAPPLLLLLPVLGMLPSASISSPKLDASGDFLPTRLAKHSGLATMANVLQNSFWECKEGSGGLPYRCWLH